jgi:hypothetical protein
MMGPIGCAITPAPLALLEIRSQGLALEPARLTTTLLMMDILRMETFAMRSAHQQVYLPMSLSGRAFRPVRWAYLKTIKVRIMQLPVYVSSNVQ